MTSLPEDAIEGKLALMLPSSELGPQGSPQLLRVVDEHERPDRPSRLEAWEVGALRFNAGTALKSNVSKSLLTGKPAWRMRACTALAERAATSNSVKRNRNCS